MKNFSVMIKPASSLCNMRCGYCFYTEEARQRKTADYGIMTDDTAQTLVSRIGEFLRSGDVVNIAFQGGEPTLSGLDWYKRFCALAEKELSAKGIRINWSFQTNGLLLDKAWAHFFREHSFLIGLSLDLVKSLHDKARPDSQGYGTFERVMAAKALLEETGIEYNVLSVLTHDLASIPAKAWRFILEHNIRYVQFIPCLDSLRPHRFARFYKTLWPLWHDEFEKGNYISIKFFDDVINWFEKGILSACGFNGHCSIQCVIEADGSTYPCDFYCTDAYRAGNIMHDKLEDILRSPAALAFRREKGIAPALCSTCSFSKQCGGGCKRQRLVVAGHGASPVCGLREFLYFLQSAIQVL
jgi:uncharacterized protein